MQSHNRRRTAFLALSVALHAGFFLALFAWATPAPLVTLAELEQLELGIFEADPGEQGSPPPATAEVPTPAPQEPTPKAKPKSEAIAPTVPIDAGTPEPERVDAAVATTADSPAGSDAVPAGLVTGTGHAPFSTGSGLGFGDGGFGSGLGGPPGAVIGLHADLARIRDTSLILEVGALLDLLPEWQRVLLGSGIDPLHDFSRVFVATPNLARTHLVLAAKPRGGKVFVERATQRIAQERGKSASFRARGGLEVAPWWNRGPTERSVALNPDGQLVIARPGDLDRVLAVSAALAKRHAAEPGMERAAGPAALLAMYEGEAAALSVEGARSFVTSPKSYVPLGLRLSLRHHDEFHAKLSAVGYYESPEHAARAAAELDALRRDFVGHEEARYLGLQAAIDEATINAERETVTLDALLTMHQVRYLLGFVSRALSPKAR
jgi:hypothetical protein